METEQLVPIDDSITLDLEKTCKHVRKDFYSTEYISATSKLQLRTRIEQLKMKTSDAKKKIVQQQLISVQMK